MLSWNIDETNKISQKIFYTFAFVHYKSSISLTIRWNNQQLKFNFKTRPEIILVRK